jgi:RimJ/RimL family protein N-acetyltransferase
MEADRREEMSDVLISLEPLRVEHADEMLSVLADPSLYEFTGGDPPSRDVLAARYRTQAAGSGRSSERWCNWIVRRLDSGEPVGFVQATVVEGSADVAWLVDVAHQGQGLAVQAVRAMITELESSGVHHLTAHVHRHHRRSQRVASAVGMKRTGAVDDDGEGPGRPTFTGGATWQGRLALTVATASLVARWVFRRSSRIAVERGELGSLDDPITAYVPELAERDERFAEVTPGHLVDMTPGIRYRENGMPWGDDATTYYAPDLCAAAVSVRVDGPPGINWLPDSVSCTCVTDGSCSRTDGWTSSWLPGRAGSARSIDGSGGSTPNGPDGSTLVATSANTSMSIQRPT